MEFVSFSITYDLSHPSLSTSSRTAHALFPVSKIPNTQVEWDTLRSDIATAYNREVVIGLQTDSNLRAKDLVYRSHVFNYCSAVRPPKKGGEAVVSFKLLFGFADATEVCYSDTIALEELPDNVEHWQHLQYGLAADIADSPLLATLKPNLVNAPLVEFTYLDFSTAS